MTTNLAYLGVLLVVIALGINYLHLSPTRTATPAKAFSSWSPTTPWQFHDSTIVRFHYSRLSTASSNRARSGRTIGGDSNHAISILFYHDKEEPAALGIAISQDQWVKLTRLLRDHQILFELVANSNEVPEGRQARDEVTIRVETDKNEWVCRFPLEHLSGNEPRAEFARQFEALFPS